MARFAVQLSPAAVRDLDKLEQSATDKILDALAILEDDPFPRGKLIKKLKGTRTTFYRLRVDKHRVFYNLESGTALVLRIVSKKDAEGFIKKLK